MDVKVKDKKKNLSEAPVRNSASEKVSDEVQKKQEEEIRNPEINDHESQGGVSDSLKGGSRI